MTRLLGNERLTKTVEQIRAEATAEATTDLRAVLKIIRDACGHDRNLSDANLVQLPTIAAHFYQKHYAEIELAATVFPEYEVGGSIAGGAWVQAPPHPAHPRRQAGHPLRGHMPRNHAAPQHPYPEPEPPPSTEAIPLCIRCGKSLAVHPDLAGPCPE